MKKKNTEPKIFSKISNYVQKDELFGWATIDAEGINGVCGGGDTIPQMITTLEEFTDLVSDNIPRVIVISGTIYCGAYGILIGSNKTIVGIDENATIYGGICIQNANNIIVNNLNIHGTWPESGPDDCVEVRNSHHIWLNHLNIWNSTDGNMDIILGSDYITVSWCKFWYSDDAKAKHEHRLNGLVSSGAGDHEDTDLGKLHVTFHHNWFGDGCSERMPRVMYGFVHVYNNYYSCSKNEYCIGADCYASLLVENNYFDGVKNPHIFMYPQNPQPACIIARGNIYDKTIGTMVDGQKRLDMPVMEYDTVDYDYFLNAASDVPRIVKTYAGTYSYEREIDSKGQFIEGIKKKRRPVINEEILYESETMFSIEDNPISYDGVSTYFYNGQNTDGSNACYKIDNPYSKINLSEKPTYENGKPVWEKGVTISYWVKLPNDAIDAAILNFNLENDLQIERSDLLKYTICQAYSDSDSSYSMGRKSIYLDKYGREYIVLDGYGKNVCYNPNYPKAGCYCTTDKGGAYYVYKKGTDGSKWTYLNYIGKGIYEDFGRRYFEENGENSMIQEALISGSLSLYASGSVGYRQDNWKGIQRNPYLYNYGKKVAVHVYNQFYYWGNGSSYTLKNSQLKTPTVKEKEKWHFVVVVIKNDWIQYYMDGKKMTTDYLNWWGCPINRNTASESFNLGYGHCEEYRTDEPSAICQNGKLILDFISDKKCKLTVGGLGVSAEKLGQHIIGTPKGTMVRELKFYDIPIEESCINDNAIVWNK